MAKSELHDVEFFDLQLRFAAKAAELTGVPLAEAVGSYTNIYVRLGFGARLDHADPDWQHYVAALALSREPAQWTHAVHRRRLDHGAGPTPAASVGCFSYAWAGPGCVRLHFHGGSDPIESPLSAANQGWREGEMAALLSRLKASSGEDVRLVGASWLYNLRSYRRLFPEPYMASLRPVAHPYQRMPLWGQLLRRDRTVRPEAATRFRAALTKASTVSELASCFALPVLTTKAPAKWLYDHVGL